MVGKGADTLDTGQGRPLIWVNDKWHLRWNLNDGEETGSQPGEEKRWESFPGKGNSKCKGPEAGIIWLGSEWEVWNDDRASLNRVYKEW